MPAATAIVGAFSQVVGTAVSVAQANNAYNQGRESLAIQKKAAYLDGLKNIRDINESITDLQGKKMQYDVDIRDAQTQVDSYDQWLGNYGKQYAQEVQSKQAQTDALKASGKETYENFLNAIGYADAMAGATGRVGAGTSQAKTTGMLDSKLVGYVGEDRRLDANGGLFGSQLTAANMEMEQLKVDLDFQRQEMEANRKNAFDSIGDWQSAIAMTDRSISNSIAERNSLQEFVAKNLKY
jgi:hypothetical protein